SSILGPAIGTAPSPSGGTQTVYQNELFNPASTVCLSGCVGNTLNAQAGATPVYARAPYISGGKLNQVPITQMDPVARNLASLYPAPNQRVLTGQYPQNDYYTVTPGSLNTNQGDGRVDFHLSDSNMIFGTISWSDTYKSSIQPFPGLLDGGNFNGVSEQDLGRNAMISWTHTFSPTMVNEARVGFTRLVTARTQANANVDAFKQAGIGGYDPTTTLNGGIPQIQFYKGPTTNQTYSQIGANDWLPTKEYNNEWDLIENLSLTKGAHSLKFGGEVRALHFPFFQVPYPHGEMNFSTDETAYPSLAGSNLSASTGDAFASFMLGAIYQGQISTTNFISSTKQAYAAYAQDTWKVTPKLTLNLGLRYELFSPIGEQFARQSTFNLPNLTLYIPKGPNDDAPLPPNFNSPATINGVTFPPLFTTPINVSRGQVGPYLIPWDKLDFGPRMGFAYNIVPQTVIRGFYGIFYGGEENQGGNPNRGESAPFNQSPQLNRPAGTSIFQPNPLFANGNPTGGITVGYPVNVFNGFPVSSLQFRSIYQNFRNPMVQEWNLAVQEQLPYQMALEVGYEGNHQSHQLLQPDPNACPTVFTSNSSITCNSLRQYPDIGSISGTASFGVGNYNAMTVSLIKRLTTGLQFQTAYTYGHALANSGTTLSGSSGLYTLNGLNYNSSYTTASWDIRHNFTTAFNYELPFGRGKAYGANLNTVVQAILGNWQLNGILTLRTGQPFTLRSSGCKVVTEDSNACGPQVLAGKSANTEPSGGRTPNEWFDTSVFAPIGTQVGQGNVGLQTNVGPPNRTLDFSVFKDFPITERWRLQFRCETTNLTNTSQFSAPDTNQQDGNFGKITSTLTGTERHVQFQ
ncbi:MAG: TonB-dependent receptor, partial [Acidobacteriaceae bacterium]|nr:TonB-dependent receptor [Acidobacteriaceae bacterium]